MRRFGLSDRGPRPARLSGVSDRRIRRGLNFPIFMQSDGQTALSRDTWPVMTLPLAYPVQSGLPKRPRIEVSRERHAPDDRIEIGTGCSVASGPPFCHIRAKPRLLSTLSR